MDTFRHEVTIGRPVDEVSAAVRRIEDHPELFADADEVHLVGEDRYRFTVSVGPLTREVEATFTTIEDRLVAWRAAGEDVTEVGEIRLAGDGHGRTILTTAVAYTLDGALLQAADALGLLEKRARRNLEDFKDRLEDGEHLDRDNGSEPS
jgi:uncharacterized membrane protein